VGTIIAEGARAVIQLLVQRIDYNGKAETISSLSTQRHPRAGQ